MLSFHYYDLLDLGVNPIVVLLVIPVSIIIPLLIVKFVYSRKKYVCTECEKIFVPEFHRTYLGFHNDLADTEKGRNQYCPHCGKITWCKYTRE